MSSAVVTGAALGIGRAVAQRLVSNQYQVVGVDRDEEALQRAGAELGESFHCLVGDIGDWDTHERAADAAQALGALDAWVNNAGIDWVGAAHEVDAEHIDAGLRVLLHGPLYGSCVAVRSMLPNRKGAIVNVSSIQGVAGFPRYLVYDAAKAGVLMATKQMAVDYAPFGIRVNAVLPGCIETPMTYETLSPELDRAEALRREGDQAPMLRVGQPEEMADVIEFLLGDRSSFVTGAGIVADGGTTARAYAFAPLGLDSVGGAAADRDADTRAGS